MVSASDPKKASDNFTLCEKHLTFNLKRANNKVIVETKIEIHIFLVSK